MSFGNKMDVFKIYDVSHYKVLLFNNISYKLSKLEINVNNNTIIREIKFKRKMMIIIEILEEK